jgi:molybdate transport system substrate-binding protein
MRKTILPALLALFVSLPIAAQRPLRVAAAADLQPVLPPILAEFEQKTAIQAQATYQSSASLTTQIENGAPFDLFLSADLSFPQRLIDKGLVDPSASNSPIPYAMGTLVLWVRKDSDLGPPSIALLENPKLKRLAIASPERAPYGRAALAALEQLKLVEALKAKMVTAENIAQAAQFVESGNADAGLISLTAALTPELTSTGTYFVIPRHLYPPIEQGAVILKSSRELAAAHRLLDFLLSAPVEAELAKRGLAPVK